MLTYADVFLLSPETPAHARETEQRLELLKIHRATKTVKMEGLQNQIRAEEEFQRGYLLLNPDIATTIELNKSNVENKHKRKRNKQLR